MARVRDTTFVALISLGSWIPKSVTGSQYKAIAPNPEGRLTCEELGLELGIYDRLLRWYTQDGVLIPLPEEAEQQAREKAEQQAN